MRYAVLFDFNGVLVNDEPIHFQAAKKALWEFGIKLTEEDYYGSLFGLSDLLLFKEVLSRQKIEDNELLVKLMIRKSEHYIELVSEFDILFTGVADLISALKKRAILGIVSSALSSEISLILKRYNLLNSFRFIISGDDVVEHKPSPEPYIQALARLRELWQEFDMSKIVAVEDSAAGIRSAKSAGIKAIGLAHYLAPSELAEADFVAGNIRDISVETIEGVILR